MCPILFSIYVTVIRLQAINIGEAHRRDLAVRVFQLNIGSEWSFSCNRAVVALRYWLVIRTAIIMLLMAVTAFAPIKRPHYIDIAPKSDIAYRSNNDVRGRKYFQQPMCGGVGILDYDGDGLMDVFFSNGAQLPELKKTSGLFYNCLLRNKGNNKFEDVTEKAGVSGQQLDFSYGVAVGDYDNDGRPDIFIANTGKNTLYHNNGNGAFSDVSDASGLGSKPPGTLSVQAAWFDYDNDGLLDLVLSNYTIWSPDKDRRCQRGDVDVYCSPRTYPSVPQRLYHNLGRRQVQRRNGPVRIWSNCR